MTDSVRANEPRARSIRDRRCRAARRLALRTRDDALDLLRFLGAPERLLRHARLVGEAADHLIVAFRDRGISFDAGFVRIGAAIHDAGKILFPHEMKCSGSEHERAGRDLMLAHGVQPELADCCVSHAVWKDPGRTFEELLVALSDKLWKGAREPDLELLVIDAAATKMGRTRWEVYLDLDAAFEEIAAGASARFRRS